MKTIRTGVYALLRYKDGIIIIKKGRGPFTGLYDLPGGKIEHGEDHLYSLEREIIEEVGLEKGDFKIGDLLTVEEDFTQHTWNGKEKDEHIVAIVYLVEITKSDFDLSYMEDGGDASGLKLINLEDTDTPKTNILKKVLKKLQLL